ncbi:MAG: type II toxin-antitoxin system RelE/ParE family toxin [Bacteroidota bacterium]
MVKLRPFDIVWSKRSLRQLKDIYLYIEKESPGGAKKVVKAISSRVQSLGTNAMIYEADQCKRNNDGSYRATHVYKFRIVYRITAKHVMILKIMHTARKPRIY